MNKFYTPDRVSEVEEKAQKCPVQTVLMHVAKQRDRYRRQIGVLTGPAQAAINTIIKKVRKFLPDIPDDLNSDLFLRTGLMVPAVEVFYGRISQSLNEVDLSNITSRAHFRQDLLMEIYDFLNQRVSECVTELESTTQDDTLTQKLSSMIVGNEGTDKVYAFLGRNFLFAANIVMALVELAANKTQDLERTKEIIRSKEFKAVLKAIARNESNVSSAFLEATRERYLSAPRLIFSPTHFNFKGNKLFFNTGRGTHDLWISAIQRKDDEGRPFIANICPALKAHVSPETKDTVLDDFIDKLIELLIEQYLPHAERNNFNVIQEYDMAF